MSLKDSTQEALAWGVILEAVKAEAEAARARLDADMAAEGSLKQEQRDHNGEKVGVVTRTGGEPVALLTDEAALMAWTREHRPDMLDHVLKPAWVELLKRIAVMHGVACDPETGQAVPGITLAVKPYGLRVTPTRAAKNAARDLVRGAAWRLALTPPEE